MAIKAKPQSKSKQSLETSLVSINQILVEPQVRKDIDEDLNSPEMELLVDSIETNGLLNPITLRKNQFGSYVLVAGHRRLNACKKLGFQKIPATISDITEDDATFIQLTENIARKDLRFFDISAKILEISKLVNPSNKKHYSQTEIGKRLGLSQGEISRHLTLAKADQGIWALCKEGKLTSLRAACALIELYKVSFPAAQKLVRTDKLSLDAINTELRSVKQIYDKEDVEANGEFLKPEVQEKMFVDTEEVTDDIKVTSALEDRGILLADPIYKTQAEKDNHKYSLNEIVDEEDDNFDQSKVAVTMVSIDNLDEKEIPQIPNVDQPIDPTEATPDPIITDVFTDEDISSFSTPTRFIKVLVTQPNGEKFTGELDFDEDSSVNPKSGQTFVQIILDDGDTTMVNVNNIKILQIGEN